MSKPVFCATCGAECIPSGCTTGYGQDKRGRKYCFACCAKLDSAQMVRDGRATLYLTRKDGAWTISNWPGSLAFPALNVRIGAHNIARTRRDARFIGPDGFVWTAVSYGEWTDIAHCKRTASRATLAGNVVQP